MVHVDLCNDLSCVFLACCFVCLVHACFADDEEMSSC